MKLPKHTKYMLLGSMIFIAISLRYPSTPHEIGWDSYHIHGLVNTLNMQGHYPNWWLHPLSPFGLTPFSYPSAVPVLLSAFSQCSGLSIESSIWLFGILCGIIAIFGSYMVAKEVLNNDIYILFVTFAFSTSEELLNYTTWTLSTRGLFIIMLPFFLYLIFRKTTCKKPFGYLLLIILVFISLVSIHHLYSFLLLPLIIYFVLTKINKFYPVEEMIKNERINRILTKSIEYIPLIIIFAIVSGLLADLELVNVVESDYEQTDTVIISTILTYARNLGIMGLFGIFGFFLLAYVLKNSLNQLLLLLFVVILTPFILISTYMTAFIAIFMYLLSGFSLFFIYNFFHKRKRSKTGVIFITFILIISLAFSAYYQINHPGVEEELKYEDMSMEDVTYDSGLWLKYFENNSVFISNHPWTGLRISGIMGLQVFPGVGMEQLQFGHISTDDFNYEIRSPTDSAFWSENFYEMEVHSGTELNWQKEQLHTHEFNDDFSNNIINKYNIKYVVINEVWFIDTDETNSTFFVTLKEDCYNIFSNEKNNIWYIH